MHRACYGRCCLVITMFVYIVDSTTFDIGFRPTLFPEKVMKKNMVVHRSLQELNWEFLHKLVKILQIPRRNMIFKVSNTLWSQPDKMGFRKNNFWKNIKFTCAFSITKKTEILLKLLRHNNPILSIKSILTHVRRNVTWFIENVNFSVNLETRFYLDSTQDLIITYAAS